jgi:hypothetical protein
MDKFWGMCVCANSVEQFCICWSILEQSFHPIFYGHAHLTQKRVWSDFDKKRMDLILHATVDPLDVRCICSCSYEIMNENICKRLTLF